MKYTRMIALLAALMLCVGLLSACTDKVPEGTQPSGTLPIPELRPGETLSPGKGSGEAQSEPELTVPTFTEFKPGSDPFASHEASGENTEPSDKPQQPTEPAPADGTEAHTAPGTPASTQAPAPQQPNGDTEEDIEEVTEYDETDEDMP